jgi:uncharacterized membrane protein YedE/YeeE
MTRRTLGPFIAGLLFALGLGLSGMTDARKVIGFLDLTGAWDASLALVMVGAIAVHATFLRLANRRPPALGEDGCAAPGGSPVDPALLAGAALFGVGWGLAGYCPGPAIVSLATGSVRVIVFVLAMLAGQAAFAFRRVVTR